MAMARTASTSRNASSSLDAMTEAKLWRNPCGLAFRLNYLALRYNTPCYKAVQTNEGLSRIEYVVIYSLALTPGGQARDIASSSGFPKNSLSRAIAQLESLDLIERRADNEDRRGQSLYLTRRGHNLFSRTLPLFEQREQDMLAALTRSEQKTLATLLAKVVERTVRLDDEKCRQDQGLA